MLKTNEAKKGLILEIDNPFYNFGMQEQARFEVQGKHEVAYVSSKTPKKPTS